MEDNIIQVICFLYVAALAFFTYGGWLVHRDTMKEMLTQAISNTLEAKMKANERAGEYLDLYVYYFEQVNDLQDDETALRIKRLDYI
jgi:hypothetical protein